MPFPPTNKRRCNQCGDVLEDNGTCSYCMKQIAENPYVWHPIENAPKDGTEVLLCVKRRAGIAHGFLVGHWMPGGCCIKDHPPISQGWYFWNGSMFDRASDPTHWMPLPPGPVTTL